MLPVATSIGLVPFDKVRPTDRVEWHENARKVYTDWHLTDNVRTPDGALAGIKGQLVRSDCHIIILRPADVVEAKPGSLG